MKMVKSLEELTKGISEIIKNETKKQKEGFLGMLLGTLLGILLTGKAQKELVKAQLEQARIFNAASSFKKLWNTKLLSRRT